MARYLIKRIIISIVTLLVILLILFLLLQFMPGSPFNDQKLSAEQVAMLKEKYGLDKPIIVQFFQYVGNMLKGDLGVSYSISVNTPITELLVSRFPVTLKIGFLSLIFGTLAGLTLGLLAAFFKNKLLRALYSILSLLGVAVPSYLFAMFFSYVLGYKWELFPMLYDYRSPGVTTVMPIMALSLMVMAVIARFTRAEAQDVRLRHACPVSGTEEQHHYHKIYPAEFPDPRDHGHGGTSGGAADRFPCDRADVLDPRCWRSADQCHQQQ